MTMPLTGVDNDVYDEEEDDEEEEQKQEMDKCILLCPNCHRITHYKLTDEEI